MPPSAETIMRATIDTKLRINIMLEMGNYNSIPVPKFPETITIILFRLL